MYTEEWKPVDGYELFYKVSSFGRFFSIREDLIMRQYVNEKGYLTIGLTGKCGRKKYKSHRLVAIAFNENPNNKPEVNHDDFDKANNFYKNLLWATQKENTNHAQRGGRRPIAKPKPVKRERPILFKMVLDMRTGHVYDSVYHLAATIGACPRNIIRKLSGERTNDTTFVYTGDRYKHYPQEHEKNIARFNELRIKLFGTAA